MKATERQKQQFKIYYKKNKERLDVYRKRLYYINHEKELIRSRKYYKNNKERLDNVAHEWFQMRLKEVMKMFGNQCCKCGYDNPIALEFHHKDGTTKKTRRSRDYLRLGYDLSKVELICANCHKEFHYVGTKTKK